MKPCYCRRTFSVTISAVLMIIYISFFIVALYAFVPCDKSDSNQTAKRKTNDTNIFSFLGRNTNASDSDVSTRDECRMTVRYILLDYGALFIVFFLGLILLLQFSFKIKLCTSSMIDDEIISRIHMKRLKFMDIGEPENLEIARAHVARLLSESKEILSGIDHPNLLIHMTPELTLDTTLRDFMYFLSFDCVDQFIPPLIRMVHFLKQILNTVQFLHSHHIYHLDINLDNVVVVKNPSYKLGFMVKIGGFVFAKRIQKNQVSVQEVGLVEFFRPPECFTSAEVDAEKIDSWGIGVMTFEVFTGGMLVIEAGDNQTINCHELIKSENLLRGHYFASAVESTWKIKALQLNRFEIDVFDIMYRLELKKFYIESWEFVSSLMHFEPKKRCGIAKALKLPLIKKILKNGDNPV